MLQVIVRSSLRRITGERSSRCLTMVESRAQGQSCWYLRLIYLVQAPYQIVTLRKRFRKGFMGKLEIKSYEYTILLLWTVSEAWLCQHHELSLIFDMISSNITTPPLW